MRDYFTNTAAGFAVASPWWLPVLQELSTVAALLLPVAGLFWILTQLYFKIWKGK